MALSYRDKDALVIEVLPVLSIDCVTALQVDGLGYESVRGFRAREWEVLPVGYAAHKILFVSPVWVLGVEIIPFFSKGKERYFKTSPIVNSDGWRSGVLTTIAAPDTHAA